MSQLYLPLKGARPVKASNITRVIVMIFSEALSVRSRVRHPMPRLHGQVMGCLLGGFGRKLPELYYILDNVPFQRILSMHTIKQNLASYDSFDCQNIAFRI